MVGFKNTGLNLVTNKKYGESINYCLAIIMGVRRRGQEGALALPWPGKVVCFLLFSRKIVVFWWVFLENSRFLHPWKKVCGRSWQ